MLNLLYFLQEYWDPFVTYSEDKSIQQLNSNGTVTKVHMLRKFKNKINQKNQQWDQRKKSN